MLPTLYLSSAGFGAPEDATCASPEELASVKTLVESTMTEATAAKEQASVAPVNSTGFAGLYQLAEDPSTIQLLTGMNKMGIVVPSDWECQSQARTGVYPCPYGEPSECRYYHNSELVDSSNRLNDMGQCVYWYCNKGVGASSDTCCSYYNGTIGATEWNATVSGTNMMYADYAETAGAAAACAATSDYLTRYEGYWHWLWYEDNFVTTAYINFDVIRLEFSHQYGLTLYSTQDDTVRIVKDSSCTADAVNTTDCYHAFFMPIQSSVRCCDF